MTNNPKRKKAKDNPYILDYYNEVVMFKDNKGIIQEIKVTTEVFNLFNNFELEDISQMHEYERHIEHSEVYEETLYSRANIQSESVEEQIEKKVLSEKLKETINELPEIQKRRIKKYYFEDKTYEEIANEENCSKVAVKYSIDGAIEKISKKFKN